MPSFAISNCLFFHCRLIISLMIKLQINAFILKFGMPTDSTYMSLKFWAAER